MTLEEWDRQMTQVQQKRLQAHRLGREADLLEAETVLASGVRHVDREPGFNCWTADGCSWHPTPRDALIELLKRGEQK